MASRMRHIGVVHRRDDDQKLAAIAHRAAQHVIWAGGTRVHPHVRQQWIQVLLLADLMGEDKACTIVNDDPQSIAIELVGFSKDLIVSYWHASNDERQKMAKNGDDLLEIDGRTEWISAYVSTLDRIIYQIADETCRKNMFPLKTHETLDPPDFEDWLKKWKILEIPELSQWIRHHGCNYPIFCSYVLSIEIVRNLLLGFREDFPDAKYC